MDLQLRPGELDAFERLRSVRKTEGREMTNTQGQNNGANAFALALVVFLNWIIAHLATSWAMPSEVQSSVQTIIAIVTTYYVARATEKKAAAQPTPPQPLETPHA